MVLFPKPPGSFSPRFLYLSIKIVLVVISSFIYSIILSAKRNIKVYEYSQRVRFNYLSPLLMQYTVI